MTHAWYVIEPKAPLVFRSGKPFGAGSRDGANFPWPSSLAGLLRTQIMDARGLEPWNHESHQQELLSLAAAGPFPAECDANGRVIEVWLPKPADAVLLKDESTGKQAYWRLGPGHYAQGAGSDLPDGLLPVTFAKPVKGKSQHGPAWWPLSTLLRWAQGETISLDDLTRRCEYQPWQVARRTHVGIDRSTFASENGRLFQTEGLDFDTRRTQHGEHSEGWETGRFTLLARGPTGINAGMVTFGGERRLSWLEPHTGDGIPEPKDWASKLTQGFALTLSTPALFDAGWKPAWLNDQLEGEVPGVSGLRVRLRAAALAPWQGVSGWDLVKQQPRAARKAVAAGATYWFELLSGDVDRLAQLWLAPISDAEQDRRDGFGIVLPRPWNPSTHGETRT